MHGFRPQRLWAERERFAPAHLRFFPKQNANPNFAPSSGAAFLAARSGCLKRAVCERALSGEREPVPPQCSFAVVVSNYQMNP